MLWATCGSRRRMGRKPWICNAMRSWLPGSRLVTSMRIGPPGERRAAPAWRPSKALREGDTLVVWKLDRLGRSLRDLVNTVHDLTQRGVGFKVLTGHGAAIDTTTPSGKLVFGIFAALAEFERELISERTKAGLVSARARGHKGGAPFKMTAPKVRLAMAAMGQPGTNVGDLCKELGLRVRPYTGTLRRMAPYVTMDRNFSMRNQVNPTHAFPAAPLTPTVPCQYAGAYPFQCSETQ